MELRKIQRTKTGTFFVCLPKDWAEKNGLERGSVVAISETSDGRLIINPKYSAERVLREITLKPSPYLDREITGKYLLGYDVIKVESKERIMPEDREKVKRAASRLVGLEIVEEDYSKIVLQCLLEPSSFPPEKVLRREYAIAASMHRDAVTALLDDDKRLAKNVVARDDEVNRLYFLLVRILRTVIQNPSLGEKLGILPINCLDYRITSSLVESIGDQSAQLARDVIEYKGNKPSKEHAELIMQLHSAVYDSHETAVKALFLHDVSLAESVRNMQSKIKDLREKIQRKIRQEKIAQYLFSAISHLTRIYENSVDIADLVIPRLSA
ncbi:phosphate uptake regulator PhoU [Candidatus Bathyarchaeota archaeon]|nr:phosphate uptake regulator PhoU [Candidatus Bathyarchaeota archaeon]